MILGLETEEVIIDEDGKAEVAVFGELPGTAALTFSVEGTDKAAVTIINVEQIEPVATPTASIASGSIVKKGTQIELFCATEGATIYYTLEGSCPCVSSEARKVYDGTPITIEKNTVIKAMAAAPDMEDSKIATFVYIVTNGDLNVDGKVDIADGVVVLNTMAEGKYDDFVDVNHDLTVDIADFVTILNIMAQLGVLHEYVDLGLPSGTLWATCNVGASSPEEYGDYFAWGETNGYNSGKTYFDWSTYMYCKGSENTLTKYCYTSNYGYNDFRDTLTELLPEDDAATANWGSDWQIPSFDQIKELYNSSYTTMEWTNLNGVYGRKITSKSNGNAIFLPAAGRFWNANFSFVGSYGEYWSRTLDTSSSRYAYILGFSSSAIDMWDSSRSSGHTVRPVRVDSVEQ